MVRQLGLVIVSFLVLLGLQFAHAHSHESYDLGGRFGLGVGAGTHSSISGDYLKNVGDEGFAGGGWLRFNLSSAFSLELSFNQFDYGDMDGVLVDESLRNRAIMLSAGYRIWATSRSRLLTQFGLGSVRSMNVPVGPGSLATYENDSYGLKFQIAYEYMLSQNWALGAMLDYYFVDVDQSLEKDLKRAPGEDFQWISPIVGLTYYFGGSSSPAPTMDSDSDGVVDSADKCAGTAAGTPVGSDGCPAAPTMMDADGDGVADEMDKCPATVAGAAVNGFGCAMTESVDFKLDVKFASGKSNVDDSFKAVLADFAAFMTKYPKATAEIAGYTDSSGKKSYNVMISQKRADAVRNYLVQNFQISGDRLTAKGYGPSNPIADNKTAAGRSENRRVVATVKSK